MGDFKQKKNEGSLFKNDKKQADTDRDYNGSVLVCCDKCGQETEYWLSAWLNTSQKTGKKWQRLSLQVKDAPGAGQQGAAPADDVPF